MIESGVDECPGYSPLKQDRRNENEKQETKRHQAIVKPSRSIQESRKPRRPILFLLIHLIFKPKNHGRPLKSYPSRCDEDGHRKLLRSLPSIAISAALADRLALRRWLRPQADPLARRTHRPHHRWNQRHWTLLCSSSYVHYFL
jgi:hypothetical protein